MFELVRSTQELLASFQQQPMLQKLDYYDDLMAQYGKMEEKSAAGDSKNFSLKDYAHQYEQMRSNYLEAAKALKMASGPYKATRDAYVAAGACPELARSRGVCNTRTPTNTRTDQRALASVGVCGHVCPSARMCAS